MTDSHNLFWDSCVFIRYVTRAPDVDLHYLDAIISDTRSRIESERRTVFYSTIIYTELRPRHLKPQHGTIDDFIASLGRNFEPIEPNPTVLRWAGELRDVDSVNPSSDPKAKSRVIGTPDAMQLMSAVFARDVLGVSDLVFHTFDEGKGRAWEDKCVPLLGFESWFPEPRAPRVMEACNLERRRPWHPKPGFNFGGTHASP